MADALSKSSASGQRKESNFSKRSANSVISELFNNVRRGSLRGVEANLAELKKNNVNVDTRNSLGSTALHLAVWRNHIPIVSALLDAGANPDARDNESGWTSLHRAFHFGHIVVASVLISRGASLAVEDFKSRTPIDLISISLQKAFIIGQKSTEVYSWGNGSNYQLGTGTARIQRVPTRVESLQGLNVSAVGSARFHNVAITSSGSILSWGFGRGGRLGHGDFDIHSGQVAVIFPQVVSFGSGVKYVTSVAAAKHHTIVATSTGEVYTWGNNREGRLGYTSVDTQATPKRVSSIKMKVVSVAASNKHSVAITESGEVWTFGCNREGQLGYGTSNSSSNCIPRMVEYFKGRQIIAASASKFHTLALSSDGEVFSWGHRMVMPRKVMISRETRKSGNTAIKFHKQDPFRVISIAAGYAHSTALSDDGLAFVWTSSDASLRASQVSLSGQHAVSVSAGKYYTAIVTKTGNVFLWEGGKSSNDLVPSPQRVLGLKRTRTISVGENHSIALVDLVIPPYPPIPDPSIHEGIRKEDDKVSDLEDVEDEGEARDGEGLNGDDSIESLEDDSLEKNEVPSLKDMCQRIIALQIAEPRNAFQLLEIADSLESPVLKSYCEALISYNLDYILNMAHQQLSCCSHHVLAEYESRLLSPENNSSPFSNHSHFTTSWSVVLECHEEEYHDSINGKIPSNLHKSSSDKSLSDLSWDSNSLYNTRNDESFGDCISGRSRFINENENEEVLISKQIRAVKKKLQQIEALEEKMAKGYSLDSQQMRKIKCKKELEIALNFLESGKFPPPIVVHGNKTRDDNEVAAYRTPAIVKGESKKKKRQQQKEQQKHVSPTKQGEFPNSAVSRIGASGPRDFSEDNYVEILDGEDLQGRKQSKSTIVTSEVISSVPVRALQCDSVAEAAERGKFTEYCHASSPDPVQFSSVQLFLPESSKSPTEKPAEVKKTSESNPLDKKKVRKGGLSQFLSGALEGKETKAMATIVQPILPVVKKAEPSAPAWGGIKARPSFASGTLLCTSSPPPISLSNNSLQPQNGVETMALLCSSPLKKHSPVFDSQNADAEASFTPTKPRKRSPSLSMANGSPSASGSFTSNSAAKHQISKDYKAESCKDDEKDAAYYRASMSVSISQLVHKSSSPINMMTSKNHKINRESSASSGFSLPKASPPAWNSNKLGSPKPEIASFKDIQQQQEEHKARVRFSKQQIVSCIGSQNVLSSSPTRLSSESTEHQIKNAAYAFSPSSASASSHSSSVPSRWYRPEESIHSSIRHIQIEESAMQELRKKYANVRVVLPSSSR